MASKTHTAAEYKAIRAEVVAIVNELPATVLDELIARGHSLLLTALNQQFDDALMVWREAERAAHADPTNHELDAAAERAGKAMIDLVGQIEAVPAHTAADCLVKARALSWSIAGDGLNPPPVDTEQRLALDLAAAFLDGRVPE